MPFDKRNSEAKELMNEKERKKEISLDRKDYIAIAIVTLEAMLPLILLIVVLVVIALLLRIL